MSIKVAIRHQTFYTYDRPVNLSPHTFRLRPAPHCRTPILSYSLKIKPEDHFINWQQDPFGNMLAAAKLMATSAYKREESRGGHYRSDFPEQVDAWKHRTFTTMAEADAFAAEIAES